ncbi:uncharacterized protein LOC113240236 [Hyposmocoma kahamanoa]|uniref:uncharacterized protein LOC113240236 n=1 Tax=Hyposmocoma kahamanoa TaxID=1477025 RepID=UPI000E6D9692|nr:uncharacterized protein LOC113240236 [Hyposmocoma kahamanoa]
MAENYTKIQEDIATKIFKSKSNFKKSPKDRLTLSYIETRLETLERQWNEFISNHRKIVYEIRREELEKTSYYISDVYDQTEEIYIEYKSLLKDTLLNLKPSLNPDKGDEKKGGEQTAVKLPKISVPKFSGKYSEWVSFRDLFTSLIHNNPNVDDVQKLHYLKGCVIGEAEQLLRHIPVTSDNYKVCWAQLESRYNNKRYLANNILKKLTSQKVLVSESASAIKQLLDTTKECLHALKSIGVNVSSWDIIIIHLISQKLDPESRKQWEQKISDSNSDLPNFNQFGEFLQGRFRSLEYLDTKVQKIEKTNCAHVATTIITCSFCTENHKLYNCKKFAKENTDTRRNFVQTHHLCFNCLGSDHSVYQCTISTRCRLCKKKHHTLLHPKIPKSVHDIKTDQPVDNKVAAKSTPPQTHIESPIPQVVTTCFSNTIGQVLLATALVKVVSPKTNSAFVLRSLLDQGSQASFITESAVQLLGLKRIPGTSIVSGLGGDQSTLASKSSVVIKIQSRLDPSFSITVKAHVLSKLTTFLPSSKVFVQALPTLPSIELADPSFDTPNRIDILLGAEVYSQILLEGLIRGSSGSVVAQHTRLGWILSGKIHSENQEINHGETCLNVVNLHLAQSNENELLKKFWELESEPSFDRTKHLTLEEKRCEELFVKTTRRDESGRYIVKLPFKTENPLCLHGNLKNIAHKRFLMLERRLLRTPNLKTEYSKVLEEYLSSGHAEVVKPSEVVKKGVVYLPHHAVVRQDKSTTKVRMVVDASCTDSNGISLNSELMAGPTLQPELRHLIMRWRCYPIALVADIVKMYRQIKVADEDVNFQRIFWRENPDVALQHLRFLRVTFGTSSAPFLAVRCLQQLVNDEGSEFPLAVSRVLNEFYMDDLMTGCHSIAEGLEIYEQITALLNRGGFPLQKWSSNSKDLLKVIKKEADDVNQNLELKTDDVIKILGLKWNREADEFRFTVDLPPLQAPVTKRKMISDIARLYDPLGWIAPAITTAKVFIQQVWLSSVDWDSELPDSILKNWTNFRNNLKALTEFRVPRWIHSKKDDKVFELHGFSDASNVAYAAVVYGRIIDEQGRVHVHLITSKTRVAPIKQVSIPRLELCGAVLLAKLLNEVADTLQVPKGNLHAWTDSSIVLAWLSSHPSRWKTFIANRVSEILTITDRDQWSHVASKENPADPASRGTQPSECVENLLWNQGPEWLHLEEINYGKSELKDTNLEERKPKIMIHVTTSNEENDELLSRFSSLRKLTRVLSFCRRVLRWKKSEKDKTENINTQLTAKEINDALLTCIKMCQKQSFYEDIDNLQNRRKLNKKSKLTSLNPFLDANQILRVGGRLQGAQVNEDMKHPFILPHRSPLTQLVIDEAHKTTLHGGPQLMLNYLRSRYWIIGAKSLVRRFVHKCVTCVRHYAQTSQQMMGQLPISRVTAHRPFHRCGVDYAGPISVRLSKGRGYHSTKGYICLFVCMATKAIHLEMVSDMTAQSFLAAFKRFVARRGHVADLWSDNGTTFVGGARELKKLLDAERSSVVAEIADWMSSNGTNWHFIPPHSPNFGGLWEAGVKSTKHHLKRVIGNSTLTFEEMTTTLSQIEACLNSRPISQLSNNPGDPNPLTPGHFLVGEPLVLVPDINYEHANISNLKRWHLTQRMVQDFWRRWSHEYLTQLQHRYKWSDQIPEPEVGSVVLVKEDDLPPARWLFGIITEKHPGLDKLTRVVTIKYKGNFIKRPVSKLIVLPLDSE